MKIYLGKKKVDVNVKSTSFLTKFSGLMFRTKNTDNLLFNFKSWEKPSIHSLFVFFKFLAVWLDENNKVIDYSIVKPFVFSSRPKKPSMKLIEIPLNERNKNLLEAFSVDKRKV